MHPTRHWLVTADNRHATLFSCTHIPSGDLHLEQVRSLQSTHEADHEHHRPYILSRGPTGGASPRLASRGHEEEEEHKRFAREIDAWLAKIFRELHPDRVNIFAAHRMHGLLRAELGDRASAMTLHEAELTHLQASELSHHPAIIKAVSSTTKETTTGKR